MVYPQENRISALPGHWAHGREHGIGVYVPVLYLPQLCLGLNKSHPHRDKIWPEVTRRGKVVYPWLLGWGVRVAGAR